VSRIEKLIMRFRETPTPTNIKLNEFIRFAEYYGFELKQGSKHKGFKHKASGQKFPFPNHDKDIDGVYIDQFLALIDVLGLSE